MEPIFGGFARNASDKPEPTENFYAVVGIQALGEEVTNLSGCHNALKSTDNPFVTPLPRRVSKNACLGIVKCFDLEQGRGTLTDIRPSV